ncbi:helix-turn-helix domain-containing protein [Saccharopolyspora phatthalungensis]|uniref:Transcriptional regulator with XRE-family HTH domain n=1 Tax=Saccharopolyspora phatthalungensis TaxID=664693 RepID=A0A840Q071_9PSEU|nr:helix-turn-helix domain-containing protein [Saccharopolyspora phatthalungensis]MBB5155932.1 transcriptional regulator with XRE-family HTH domain [Saccharopolyspora phatthalungensis]
MAEQSAAGDTFAAKLRRLFSSVKREDGSEYSKPDVAAAVGVSRGYLYDLLNGKSEPSHAVVVKIAEFFGVDMEYFTNSDRGRELNRQHEILARLGEHNVRQLAARASQLSPERLRSVMEYIDFQASQDNNGPSSG